MYLHRENAGNIAKNHKFPLKGDLKCVSGIRYVGFMEIYENTLAEIDQVCV